MPIKQSDMMKKENWLVKVTFELLSRKREKTMTGSFDFIVNSDFYWSQIKDAAEELLELNLKLTQKAKITEISLTGI